MCAGCGLIRSRCTYCQLDVSDASSRRLVALALVPSISTHTSIDTLRFYSHIFWVWVTSVAGARASRCETTQWTSNGAFINKLCFSAVKHRVIRVWRSTCASACQGCLRASRRCIELSPLQSDSWRADLTMASRSPMFHVVRLTSVLNAPRCSAFAKYLRRFAVHNKLCFPIIYFQPSKDTGWGGGSCVLR